MRLSSERRTFGNNTVSQWLNTATTASLLSNQLYFRDQGALQQHDSRPNGSTRQLPARRRLTAAPGLWLNTTRANFLLANSTRPMWLNTSDAYLGSEHDHRPLAKHHRHDRNAGQRDHVSMA